MIGYASVCKGLYLLQSFGRNLAPSFTFSYEHDNVNLWHYRLGHPGHKILEKMCKAFPYIQIANDDSCDICHFVKQHKLPFPKNISLSSDCFDMIHCDIWGPISTPSVHGHKYFLTVVEYYSRHTWVFLMHNKGQTRELLQTFIVKIKTQHNKAIKVIRTDNGPEFNCSNIYDSYGIEFTKEVVLKPHNKIPLWKGNINIY